MNDELGKSSELQSGTNTPSSSRQNQISVRFFPSGIDYYHSVADADTQDSIKD